MDTGSASERSSALLVQGKLVSIVRSGFPHPRGGPDRSWPFVRLLAANVPRLSVFHILKVAFLPLIFGCRVALFLNAAVFEVSVTGDLTTLR